jgi:hypothetical protein
MKRALTHPTKTIPLLQNITFHRIWWWSVFSRLESPVLRKNSILIALDITSSSRDNRQGQLPILWRDALVMKRFTRLLRLLIRLACTLLILLVDAVRFLLLCLRPSPALAAENLFLRKQLALYQERHVKP